MQSKLPPTRAQLLQHLRGMRKVLQGLVTEWNVPATITEVTYEPDGEPQSLPVSLSIGGGPPGGMWQPMTRKEAKRPRRPHEHPEADPANWNRLWQAANALRGQADALAVLAARQGQIARQRAHPANRGDNDAAAY